MERRSLIALVAAVLLGAFGFAAWSAFSGDDTITYERGGSFDLAFAPAASAPRPPEDLRDAVASRPSPRPIPLTEMAPAVSPAAPPQPAVRPFLTPRLERAARASRAFVALLRAPARLFAASSGSALGSPRALRAFLADKAAVERYMDSALVRVVLNSPAAAKAVIGSPAVVRAFLSSPALRDPATVRALLSSRMVVKMLDCPGVQEALSDPKVIRGLATDPETVEFLGRNPEALNAIAGAAPDLTRALTR